LDKEKLIELSEKVN